MLLMLIHALGIDKCIVVVKLLCYNDFCEYELKMENVGFDDFE